MTRAQLNNRTSLHNEIPLATPYCIFIDPSSACNFKCSFCMNSHITNPKVMGLPLYKHIIDGLQYFTGPVKTIRLYGFGEPLVNPRFCEMVAYAKKSSKVLAVDTTTNGSLLDNATAADLILSGIDRINVSIEAMSTDGYRKFTGNPTVKFEDIVSNLTFLYKNKPQALTLFVKVDGDYLSADEQAQFMDVFGPISDGRAIEHTMNCWRDFEIQANPDVGIYGQPLEDVQVCPYIFYGFTIHSDGVASACFLDWNRKLVIGDARTQRLPDIWNAPEMVRLRLTMLRKQRAADPVCAGCNQLRAGMPVNLDPHADAILERAHA